MMTSGSRLATAGAVIAGTTAYMGYLGAASSWTYYLTVDECVAANVALEGARLRVSGVVTPGSLAVAADRSQATFCLAGSDHHLQVTFTGRPPDNLAEAREVVVEGWYIDKGRHLHADQVFTRCASKYRSSEGGDSQLTVREIAGRGP